MYLSCHSRIQGNKFAWGNRVTGWEWYRNGQRADGEFRNRGAVAYPASDYWVAEFKWTPPGPHVSPASLSCKPVYGPGSVTTSETTTAVTIDHWQPAEVGHQPHG